MLIILYHRLVIIIVELGSNPRGFG